VLGLEVTWRDADRLPAGRHVMVSNHSTTGDLMVLYSLRRRCVHLVNAALPPRVTQARLVGGAGRMGGHAERKRACDLRVGQTRLWPPWGAVIFTFCANLHGDGHAHVQACLWTPAHKAAQLQQRVLAVHR